MPITMRVAIASGIQNKIKKFKFLVMLIVAHKPH